MKSIQNWLSIDQSLQYLIEPLRFHKNDMVQMNIPNDYIPHLMAFVELEQDTQNLEQADIWRKPLQVRLAEGVAVAGISIKSYVENRAILSIKDNLSKFREGDALRLHRGDPTDEFINCELIEEIGEDTLVIKPGFGKHFINLTPADGWILDFDIVDIRHIQLSVLELVNRNPELHNYFHNLLNGRVKPFFIPESIPGAVSLAESMQLNPSQVEAFSQAYASTNHYLIQGPPGTGKTRVLAHLAETFAKEGKNVLVTAFTHRAINNALRSIGEKTGYPQLIKIGQQINAGDLVYKNGSVQNYEYLSSSPFQPNSKGVIIGGTCFSLRTKRLQEMPFDVVIFDEAGQMTLPLAIIGMLAAPKSIFIGDHKQMAPVITSKHPVDWVSKSIFEVLHDHIPGTMLDITYRMNQEINKFPSERFYAGRVHSYVKNAGARLVLLRPPKKYAQILDPANPDVFVRVEHVNNGLRSIEEATIIAGVIFEAIECGIRAEEIAVVAPYRAQGRLIRRELKAILRGTAIDPKEIVVDTVERIQGQERDMIIVSLTTSDPAHAAQNAKFYFQPNRLNVAITRPRTKRIIVGSSNLFAAQPTDPEHKQWVKNFQDLYEQCKIIQFSI